MELLKKIRLMTSNVGIYQHGKFNKPAPEFGYAIEDQARALLVVNEFKDKKLKSIYLNFILRAKREDGLLYHYYYDSNDKYRNDDKGLFRDKEIGNKEINPDPGHEEAYGLVLWALLTIKNGQSTQDNYVRKIVKNLIENAYKWTSSRAISVALLGLLNLNIPDNLESKLKLKLHNLYFKNSEGNWKWFESCLVYANAVIPWALWEIYLKRKCKTSLKIAKETTAFLIKECQENNVPSPVGNRGWYFKGGVKALYDQQPIDSAYMVCCLEKAYYATKNNFYKSWAEKWYRWFFGYNIKGISLIDKNFACYDGLTPEGVNLNQGAESNICFLMAYLAAKRLGIIE